MASLLESLLSQVNIGGGAAASAAARIASIQSGNWDAAEYGMTAAQAIANIEAAQTPEQMAAVESDMRKAAIIRASLDTTTGRVALMVAGKAAWHRLGVHIESATDSANAIVLAGLDWKVVKVPLSYRDSTGTIREQTESYALIREDTGAMLGGVGSRYAPIQNAQGFAFLDSVLGEFGARYESAGSIHGGRKVFMTVRLPGQDFSVNGTDEVQAYAVLFNPHDGSGKSPHTQAAARIASP